MAARLITDRLNRLAKLFVYKDIHIHYYYRHLIIDRKLVQT